MFVCSIPDGVALKRACLLGVAVVAVLLAIAPSPAGPATIPSAPLPPAVGAAPLGMHRPMPKPVSDEAGAVTDRQVDLAIRRGVDYLLSNVFEPGNPPRLRSPLFYDPDLWTDRHNSSFESGEFILTTYALLESGLAINDSRLDPRHDQMRALIEGMKKCDVRGHFQTYDRGIRATALAVYDRPEDRDTLMEDAYWLVNVCDGGAYTYDHPTPSMYVPPDPTGYRRHPIVTTGAPPEPVAPPSLLEQVNKVLSKPDSQPSDPPAPSTQPDYSRPKESAGELGRQLAMGRKFADTPADMWDNSNSQYGLLGVWSAAECGMEIPESYWEAVDRHWTDCEQEDGLWPYTPEGRQYGKWHFGGDAAMNYAALASLMVTHEYLVPARISDQVGRDPYCHPVYRGLDWLENGHDVVRGEFGGRWEINYTPYALERVGLISGFKHFGQQDWYRLVAGKLVFDQGKDGSWRNSAVETSYALLCLARGRHPVLMSKLRFDGTRPRDPSVPDPPITDADLKANKVVIPWRGFWANRPRDAANLARFVGNRLERRFNWEVVNLALDWTTWNDAPVLELASHQAPQFTKQDIDMIRQYILAGGILFTQADGGSKEFNLYAVKLARELFPQYEMMDVPAGHPLYTNETVYNVNPRPPLKMVTNGSRVLILHSPTDITRWWQQRDDIRHKDAFQLGMNLFVYAAGKQNFRNRLQEAWVPRPTDDPLATVNLARITYAGDWDPEPFAWRCYGNWLQCRTGTRIETQAVIGADLKSLDPAGCPLAHLTGTAKQNFTLNEISSVRQYVQSGGVLLIDQCGGMGTFDQSAEALLAAAFPAQKLEPLPINHPLLRLGNPGTQDVSKPIVRSEVVARYGRGAGILRILSSGKGHVLYTPLDITSGLLGTSTLGILGYDPEYAQSLVKNIVFWTLDGQADETASAPPK